jgi:outer membrane protein
MKHIISTTLLVWLALAAGAQQAQEVKKLSLQDAVSLAKSNNVNLKNNKLEVLQAQQKVKEVLASGLPNVNAEGTFLHNIEIPTQRLPNFINAALPPGSPRGPEFIDARFGVTYSTSAKITATQLLFDGGFLMGVKASKEFVNLSKVNLERNAVQTTVDVSKAYYMVLVIQTNIKLLSANIQQLEKVSFDLEQASKNGLIDKLEFDRVSLQLSNLKLQREKLTDQEKIALMLLKLQLGVNIQDNVQLTDELESLYSKKQSIDADAKPDLTKRPEYRLMQQQIRLYELSKKRYQYGYAPSLAAFATHQQNTFGNVFSDVGATWFPGTFWGLSLNIPVFDGLRKHAQIQQEDISLKIARNNLENLESSFALQVNAAQANFKRVAQQITIQKKNLDLAQDIYNKVELKYKNGLASSLELTTSQTDLETARANYLTTVYDFFIAELELQQSLGNIN